MIHKESLRLKLRDMRMVYSVYGDILNLTCPLPYGIKN